MSSSSVIVRTLDRSPRGVAPTVRVVPDFMVAVQKEGSALDDTAAALLAFGLQVQLNTATGEFFSVKHVTATCANTGTATVIGAWLPAEVQGENREFLLRELEQIGNAPLDTSTTLLRFFIAHRGLKSLVDTASRAAAQELGVFFDGSDVELDAGKGEITTVSRIARRRNNGKHGVVIKLKWEEVGSIDNREFLPCNPPKRVKVETDTRFEKIADWLDKPLVKRGIYGTLVDAGLFPDRIPLAAPDDHDSLDVLYNSISVRENGELAGLHVTAHAQRTQSRPCIAIEGPALVRVAGNSVLPRASYSMRALDLREVFHVQRWSSPDAQVRVLATNGPTTDLQFDIDPLHLATHHFTLVAEIQDADTSNTDPQRGRRVTKSLAITVQVVSSAQVP